MKRIRYLLLLVAASGYSQFSGGIKAGAMLASQKFENPSEKGGVKTGYYAGGFGEYKFGRVGAELDVTYNAGGSKGSVQVRLRAEDYPSKQAVEYDVKTLQVSAAAKFYITNMFALKVGGFYGSILSVDADVERIGNFDYSDDWKKTDAGVLFGLNLNISKHLFLDGTYLLGVPDIRGLEKSEVYTRNIKIGAGYRF